MDLCEIFFDTNQERNCSVIGYDLTQSLFSPEWLLQYPFHQLFKRFPITHSPTTLGIIYTWHILTELSNLCQSNRYKVMSLCYFNLSCSDDWFESVSLWSMWLSVVVFSLVYPQLKMFPRPFLELPTSIIWSFYRVYCHHGW